jgi:hypothetical protein
MLSERPRAAVEPFHCYCNRAVVYLAVFLNPEKEIVKPFYPVLDLKFFQHPSIG